MADKPILFSAPMVRALLAGTKTQTRRTLNPQPHLIGTTGSYIGKDGKWHKLRIAVGDRLYVREHWRTHAMFDAIAPRDLQARSIHYCSDGEINSGKHRQAMHMPRWASRLTLTVTDVRVERLQDINAQDCWAEGCSRPDMTRCLGSEVTIRDNARNEYRKIWEGINGEGSWGANPWVVCYSFSVAKGNIDQIAKVAA